MYKPLPDGLTIKNSDVQGLGLFATQDFMQMLCWVLFMC